MWGVVNRSERSGKKISFNLERLVTHEGTGVSEERFGEATQLKNTGGKDGAQSRIVLSPGRYRVTIYSYPNTHLGATGILRVGCGHELKSQSLAE